MGGCVLRVLLLCLAVVCVTAYDAQPSSGSVSPSAPPLVLEDDADSDSPSTPRLNYASQALGASIASFNPEAKGAWSIITGDPDGYFMSPCSAKKWIVVGLPEDICVDTVVLSNNERYSSQVHNFLLLASTVFPTADWTLLGEFNATNVYGDQAFALPTPQWARYIKLSIKSHFGQEFYCTLTSFKVHGTTMLETLNLKYKDEEARRTLPVIEPHVFEPALPAPVAGDTELSSLLETLSSSLDNLDARLPVPSTGDTRGDVGLSARLALVSPATPNIGLSPTSAPVPLVAVAPVAGIEGGGATGFSGTSSTQSPAGGVQDAGNGPSNSTTSTADPNPVSQSSSPGHATATVSNSPSSEPSPSSSVSVSSIAGADSSITGSPHAQKEPGVGEIASPMITPAASPSAAPLQDHTPSASNSPSASASPNGAAALVVPAESTAQAPVPPVLSVSSDIPDLSVSDPDSVLPPPAKTEGLAVRLLEEPQQPHPTGADVPADPLFGNRTSTVSVPTAGVTAAPEVGERAGVPSAALPAANASVPVTHSWHPSSVPDTAGVVDARVPALSIGVAAAGQADIAEPAVVIPVVGVVVDAAAASAEQTGTVVQCESPTEATRSSTGESLSLVDGVAPLQATEPAPLPSLAPAPAPTPAPAVAPPSSAMHALPPVAPATGRFGIPLEDSSKSQTVIKVFSQQIMNLEFEQEVIRRYISEFHQKFNGVIGKMEGAIEATKADLAALKAASATPLPSASQVLAQLTDTGQCFEDDCPPPTAVLHTIEGLHSEGPILDQLRMLALSYSALQAQLVEVQSDLHTWRVAMFCVLLAVALGCLASYRLLAADVKLKR